MPDLRISKALLWAVALLTMLGVAAVLLADGAEAVDSITLTMSGSDTVSVTPGNSATFKVNVTNILTTTTLTVNITKSTAPTGWTAQLSQTQLSIQALQTKSVTLTVGVPSDAVVDTVGKQITITADPDYGDTKTITTTTKVSQVYGIQTYSSTLLKHTLGGTGVTFTLKVNNTGNGQDNVAITHSGEPSGWTVTHVSSVTVTAGGSKDVTVSVVPPSKAIAGTYQTTVKATSSDGTKSSQETFIIIIDPLYGLTLSSSDVSKYVTPKIAAYYNMSVTNTGNTGDSAQISIEGVPSGWTVLPTSNPVALVPNETKTFQILVTAPSTALAGAQYQFTLKATSNGNSSIVRTLTINAVVNQIYDPRVTPLTNTMVVAPGSSATFKINVTNFGNGNDTVDLSVASVPAGQGWVYNFNPTSVQLTSGQTKTVDLTFTIGPHAAYGNNQITVEGTSHGTTKKGIATVIVSVTQFYNIAFAPDGAATKRADPGGMVTFNFSVTNTGNGPDDITFSVIGAPAGWVTYFSKTTVYNVPANGTQATTLTLEVPSTAKAATYKFDVKATSDGNTSVFRTIKNVTVIINQLYAVDMSASKTYLTGQATIGDTVDLTVTNSGSGTDNFTMSASGTYATWVTFNVTTVMLAPGASTVVKATVVPPSSQPVGTVSIPLRATSKGKATVYKDVTLSFEVTQIYKPEVTVVEGRLSKKPGETATFSLVLKNAGNGADTIKVNFTTNPRNLATHTLATPFVTLNQGSTRSFSVNVAIPADEPVGDLTFVLLATSQNSSSATSSVTLTVSVQALYSLTLYSYDVTASAEPTDSDVVEVRIKNDGNGQDSYTLKATGVYYKWIAFDRSPVQVGRGAEAIVNVTVTLPDDTEISTGKYYINITATSQGDSSKFKTLELVITVLHKEDVDVTITDLIRSRSTDPGGQVVYSLTVKNEGLKTHVINLAKSGTNTDWAKLNRTSVVLTAGATAQATLTVSVPKGQAPSTFDITVTGTLDDMTRRTDSVVLSTTVNRIWGVLVDLNLTEVAALPGVAVSLKVNVNNTGNARDTFVLAASANKAWVTFSPAEITLDPDANGDVVVTFRSPSDPLTKMGDYRLNLTVTSKSNSSLVSRNPVVYEVEQVFDVTAKVAPSALYVDPGQIAVYNITVKNTGNGQDNFTFIIGGTRKAWGQMSRTRLTIEPGKESIVALRVRVPANQPVETAMVTVLVTSEGNSTANATIATWTTILPYFGVDLTVTTSTKAAFPSKVTTFDVKVKNTGNANDVFRFDITGDNAEWMGALGPVSIAPGQVVSVIVNITPPSDAINGQYTFTINASSDTQRDAFDLLDLRVTINVYYGLRLTIDKTAVQSRPNVTESVLVSVENRGNVNDTFDLRVLGTYASWVTLSNTSVTAAPAATGVSTATIRVPANVTSGVYVIRFEATSVEGGNVTETQLTISITLTYGATMTGTKASTPAYPNATLPVEVRLRNTGNTRDTFDLEVRQLPSDLWDVTLPFRELAVPANTTVWFNLSVAVPAGIKSGTYQVLLRATSRGAPVPAPFASTPLNISISFAVSATGPDERITIKTNIPSSALQVIVKNEGLGLDTFTMKAEEPYSSWLTISPLTVTLGAGQSTVVEVVVRTSATALAGDYTLKVRATSSSDRTISALAEVRVRVSQDYSVALNPESIELTGEAGDTVQATFTISNLGNGMDTISVAARAPSGSRLEPSLNFTFVDLGARKNVTVRLSVKVGSTAVAGEYTINLDILSSSPAGASDSATVLFTIPAVRDIQVRSAGGQTAVTIQANSGENQQLALEVKNTGNADETIELFVNSTSIATWITFDKEEVRLAPGETALVQATISVPLLALSGTSTFEVVATSTRGDAQDQLAVTLVVKAYHSVYLTSDNSIVSVNPRAGQDAVFDITVHNDGNTQEVVTLDVAAPSGWGQADIEPETVTVGAFTTARMTVTFRAAVIPSNAQDSNSIEVTAIYTEESPALNLMITVLKAKLAIAGSDIVFLNPMPKVGDTVQVEVTVRNTGVVESTGVTIVLLVGGLEVSSTSGVVVPASGSQKVTFNWEVGDENEGITPIVEVRIKETSQTTRASTPPAVQEAEGGFMAQLRDLSFETTLVVGLVIGLIIGLVLVVGVHRRSKRRVEAARAAGMAEGIAVGGEGKPAPKPAPPGAEEPEGEGEPEEGVGEPEAEEEGAPAPEAEEEPEAEGPPVTVQCPRCGTINKVTVAKRPYEFRCKDCSALLRLSK